MKASNFQPRISFIIPVYNAEAYLKECLDSVVCQITGNELILVDDSSIDSSGQICDDYANSYNFITVIHIENHGVAYARNLGVDYAVGEYIVFLDSDDYINIDFSERFVNQSMDADVIFYPVRKQYGKNNYIPMGDGLKKERLHKQHASDVLDYIAHCPKFPASPWGKLVRRDFLNRNQIRFLPNVGHEDYDWTYLILRYCQSYDFFEEGMYTYRQVPLSRSSMQNPKNLQAHIELIDRWIHMEVPDEFRIHLNAYLAYQYAMALPFWGSLTATQRRLYRSKMKQYQYLLRFGKTRRNKIIHTAVLFLGVENTAQLLYHYVYYVRRKRLGSQ